MGDYLLMVLEAPLLACGGEVVDARGVITDFPGTSMLTGLLGNALGWRRTDHHSLASLQARLCYAARIDREGERFTDFQTAQLARDDKGWTTRGAPEGRAGSHETYGSPHLRYREYEADKRVVVALRLDPADDTPTLTDLAAALDTPARPLFIGRKPCLPSVRLCGGVVEADGLLAALTTLPAPPTTRPRVMLPESEPARAGDEIRPLSDLRQWQADVHGGVRTVRIRTLAMA
jgi:CRISPR system Cascade subunit CasD